MSTTVEAVRQKITELVQAKADTLAEIEKNKNAALAQIAQSGKDIRSATEAMDITAFEAAKAEQHRAKMALEMYDGRFAQISKRQYVTEQESDEVLDSLAAYGDQIADKFKSDVVGPLKKLQDILSAYLAERKAIDDTMLTWQNQIFPNYRAPGSSRLDPKTGEWTNRMERPRQMTLDPCKDADDLQAYLKTAEALLK